jgi:hypothetical protein
VSSHKPSPSTSAISAVVTFSGTRKLKVGSSGAGADTDADAEECAEDKEDKEADSSAGSAK